MTQEKVITVRMPEAMHRELKAYCYSASRSMNGEITALIQAKLSMVEPMGRTPPPSPQPSPQPSPLPSLRQRVARQRASRDVRDKSQNERGADQEEEA